MKSSITSNLRPLLRAFYPFVIAIAALCDMPRSAYGQLYVTQLARGIVSEYNATTGDVINAKLITKRRPLRTRGEGQKTRRGE